MYMVLTVAWRNIVHDRLRFAATLAGLAVAITLIGVQLGLYVGASRLITTMIDHTSGQLWVMPLGVESFEDGLPLLTEDQRHRALTTPGVKSVAQLVVSFADWLKPDGAQVHVVVVGADPEDNVLSPWNVVEKTDRWAGTPNAVVLDKSYLGDLGVNGIGDQAAIEGLSIRVAALTDGIRSFTQSPYVFTSLDQARKYVEAPAGASSFLVIKLDPNADPKHVQKLLRKQMGGDEVLTTSEFASRCLDRWLMQTGAGVALLGGLILGIVFGILILGHTLLAMANDHIEQYATLRAFGSTGRYIIGIVLAEAALSCLAGSAVGVVVVAIVACLSQDSSLPLVISPTYVVVLSLIAISICVVSSLAAALKTIRADPHSLLS